MPRVYDVLYTREQNNSNNRGKKMNRTYYIECKINGIQEKFRFENKKALEDYLVDKGQVLRCGNVTNLDCYSVQENVK